MQIEVTLRYKGPKITELLACSNIRIDAVGFHAEMIYKTNKEK